MSRVLVVGMGVPGFVPWMRHAGPGLRAAHLALALARSGHRVLLVAVLAEGERAPLTCSPPPPMEVLFTTERGLVSSGTRARLSGFSPEAVVGVTVYASSLATRLGLAVPFWADVFGDILAEAQAKAARCGSDWSIVHFWTLLRPVLERGDRFSAVSRAQANALVGQLGMAGRLSSRTAGEELVAVIPCSSEASAARTADEEAATRRRLREELGFGANDFVLLASGGVNTWCDVETTVAGVGAAMEAESRLRLVVTGGDIPGHDEVSYAAFVQKLDGLDPARVRVLGWIDSSRLPDLYLACDLGLHVERPLYERSLGAENRVVEWLAHGLPSVTTALSEAGAELLARGFAFASEASRADSLDRALRVACARPETIRAAGRDGAAWVASERAPDLTAVPLVEWCASPRFAGDAAGQPLLRIGLVSQPATSAEMLEAYVAELPVGEVARRGARWLWRRTWTALGGLFSRPISRRTPPPGAVASKPEPSVEPATAESDSASGPRIRADSRRW